jgi:hypothetical protein
MVPGCSSGGEIEIENIVTKARAGGEPEIEDDPGNRDVARPSEFDGVKPHPGAGALRDGSSARGTADGIGDVPFNEPLPLFHGHNLRGNKKIEP